MKKSAKLIESIVKTVDRKVREFTVKRTPVTLYDPARYLLQGGGKRLRAVIVALSCGIVDKKFQKAMPAATAVELLHNFSLVHDDIMDNDDLRRGRETIHKKWNANVAILTGDALAAMAFRSLSGSPEKTLPRVFELFSEAFVGLCEGQALDKEFEKRDVKVRDYLGMIGLKTALLFKASAQIGAIIGGAETKKEKALAEFGYNLGMAFQIQDDLLDVIGEEAALGKPIGSDLMEGKKTYIALLCSGDKYGKDFLSVFQSVTDPDILKRVIEDFKKFLLKSGVQQKTEKAIRQYADAALRSLARFKSSPAKDALTLVTQRIMARES